MDLKYALVPASVVARAISWTPIVTIVLSVDDGLSETPTLSCDSTTAVKSRTREPATFIIGANIHDNLQRCSGRRQSPLYSQRADYGWSDIGQPSSNQHADWYDQSNHCLSSTFQFTSIIAEVWEPSATLPPSTLHASFPSPVLPSSRPSLY